MRSCKRPLPTGAEPRCAGKAQETTSLFFQRAAQAYIWSARLVNMCVNHDPDGQHFLVAFADVAV